MSRKQLSIFVVLLAVYALTAVVSYLFFFDQLTQGASLPQSVATENISNWVLGIANAGIILVLYGLLGWIGNWFAMKLGFPGIFREPGTSRGWFWMPLIYGLGLGIFFATVDQIVALNGAAPHFPHPAFPFSILASLSAGIGEEIIFRGFVFGLWAYLLNLVLKHWNKTRIALWIANILAALAFGASHLYSVTLLFGGTDPSILPPIVIGELFLLNGILGIAAGEHYMKNGLIAAAGVHFWTDIVWHVIWPFLFA